MKLQPYTAYKDSGVPWLGQIPAQWEVRRLKSLLAARITDGPHTTPTFISEGIPFLSVDGIQNGQLVFRGCRYISPEDHAEFRKKAAPRRDDILLGKAASTGKIARVKVDFEFSIWSPLALIRPNNSQVTSSFLEYTLKDVNAQWQIETLCTMNTQRNISMDDIPKLLLPLPPVTEQIEISHFLDSLDGRINRTIRAKRKLIALLNEQKQAIIHRAVTHGLDLDVALRPSGVEWLGDIPAHWEVVRIKYLLREVDVRSTTGEETLLSLRMIQGLVPHDEHFARPGQAPTLIGYKVVHPGQIVLNRLQANNGLVFASDIDGVVSPDYAVFDAIGDVDLYYLTTLFRTSLMKHKFRVESKGLGTGTAGFLRLYTDRFGMIPVPLPPRDEQYQIMQALDAQLAGLNSTISRVEREIDLIREYRTRLIADVVTGKLDVRAAAAGLPEELAEIEPEAADDEDASFDAEPDGQWEEETDAP